MDRVLGLQSLSEFTDSEPSDNGCSSDSGTCSSSSGAATGVASTCSIGCGGSEELDW